MRKIRNNFISLGHYGGTSVTLVNSKSKIKNFLKTSFCRILMKIL